MKRQDCQQYQNLLMGGAQLQAGLVLKPEDQQALHRHLSSCTTCQALAHNLLSMDNLLRACLHDRWDAIPQPKRIAAKVVQAKMRRRKMSRAMKTMIGALAALALVAIIFFTTRQITPAGVGPQKIPAHIESALIQYADLPADTDYFWWSSAEDTYREPARQSNEMFTELYGQGAGEKYITDYERLDGWSVRFQRKNSGSTGFDTIENWITLHQTPEGAQKWASDRAHVPYDFYLGWPVEPLGSIKGLGDLAHAYRFVNALSPGFERNMYQVDFAYQTVSVRVRVTDLSSRVTLEDAVDLAQIVLSHLKE